MITCKEDLQNTYVKNDNGELANRYISASKRFGFSQLIVNKESASYFVCGDETIGGRTTSDCFDNLKQLKISDFKPQKPTRTEYVKVTESIFDLKEEFEKGELYYSELSTGRNFIKIEPKTSMSESYLLGNLQCNNLYRRIENPVDFVDAVTDFLNTRGTIHQGEVAGLKWQVGHCYYTDDDFLEMCRIALRANGELPTA